MRTNPIDQRDSRTVCLVIEKIQWRYQLRQKPTYSNHIHLWLSALCSPNHNELC
jgi:hypothetical protein